MTPGLTERNFTKLVYLGDADFFGELVCAHLKMIGNLQVDPTTSCDNLLSRLENADILVIEDGLQDCNMQELLTVIRLRTSDTPVVVLTANTTSESRLNLMLLGVTDVIVRDDYTCEMLETRVRLIMEHLEFRKQLSAMKKRLEGVSLSASAAVLDGVTIPYDHEQPLEVYTMGIIRHFLGKYNNNVVLVARKLGVGKSTIYRYIKENKLTLSGEPSILRQPVDTMAIEGKHDVIRHPGQDLQRQSTVYFGVPAASGPVNDLLDLTYLERISRGDRSFIIGMMNVFFRTMDTLLPRISDQYSNGDLEGMLRSLVSMKSPLESMGMQPARRCAERLEKDILQGFSPAVVSRQYEEFVHMLKRSMEALSIQRFEWEGSSGK